MARSDDTAGGFVWYPSDAFKRDSNWAAFIAAENLADYPMLERKAAQDPEWFWDALIRFLGVQFVKPYSRVLDQSKGIEWPQWCIGATGNMTLSLLDRHLAARPRRPRRNCLGRRGRNLQPPQLPATRNRGEPLRLRPCGARLQERRRCRHLPADGAGGCCRLSRPRTPRLHHSAAVLGLWRRRHHGAAQRRRSGCGDHGRRFAAPRQAGRDEGRAR